MILIELTEQERAELKCRHKKGLPAREADKQTGKKDFQIEKVLQNG
jgi:hypothetical protein